jgi:4'-phosphopantetheinyl transferase
MQVAADMARVVAIQPYGVQIWAASPRVPNEAQWRELARLLDAAEQDRARQFKTSDDRRAYVLAHALRRVALARVLAVGPDDVVVSHAANGRPLLAAAANRPEIFFSHSRSREMVVCAVTRAGPVGIDVEPIDAVAADFDLLAPYMVLPDTQRREAELGPDPSAQFFFYWTALEAFWKAAGTGLSSSNPRILCRRNRLDAFEIALVASASVKLASIIPVAVQERCSVTVVLATQQLKAVALQSYSAP